MPSSADARPARPVSVAQSLQEISSRAKRIETKLTRLAEASRVQVADTADGITVDTVAHRVTLPTTNRTFASVLTALVEAGAESDDMYVVVDGATGESIATLRV